MALGDLGRLTEFRVARPSQALVSPTAKKPANPRWRHALGRAAEELCARHLEERGCGLVARRFSCLGGEIDLIVEDRGVIAFVEVKARHGKRYGDAAEAVNYRKQRRLLVAARTFLRRRRWSSRRCRFDVCSVNLGDGKASVRWIRDAFRP